MPAGSAPLPRRCPGPGGSCRRRSVPRAGHGRGSRCPRRARAGRCAGSVRGVRAGPRPGRRSVALGSAFYGYSLKGKPSKASGLCRPSAAVTLCSWQLWTIKLFIFFFLHFSFLFDFLVDFFSFGKACLNQQGSFCSMLCDTVSYIREEIGIICERHESVSGCECETRINGVRLSWLERALCHCSSG